MPPVAYNFSKKQHQENKKQHPGNFRGACGDATKAKKTGYQGNR